MMTSSQMDEGVPQTVLDDVCYRHWCEKDLLTQDFWFFGAAKVIANFFSKFIFFKIFLPRIIDFIEIKK